LHEISLSKIVCHHYLHGQLAQAKNGDKQFRKEKFHAANGKAQHALLGWVGGCEWGERGGGFVFLPCSIIALAISTGEKQ